MLDEAEWAQLQPELSGFMSSIKRHREYHNSSSIEEARANANMDPALEIYFKLTGFKETNIDALWHHRISLYGEPCPECGKPLRTHVARFCAECGWKKSNPALNNDAPKDGAPVS
jgi:hypothetical protein